MPQSHHRHNEEDKHYGDGAKLDRPAFKGYLSTFEGYLVTFISIRFTPYCCHARVTPQAQNGEVKHYRDGAKLDRHAFKSHSSTFEDNLVTFISIKYSPYCHAMLESHHRHKMGRTSTMGIVPNWTGTHLKAINQPLKVFLVTFLSIKFSPYCCHARVSPQAKNREDKQYGDRAKLDRHTFKGQSIINL
jgi:hypothetical protein